MISVEQLTEAEAQRLNGEQRMSYWAIPIAFAILLLLITFLLNWLFDAPWSIFWWAIGGIFALFYLVKLFVGKSAALHGGEKKAIRRGKVLHATYKGNSPVPKRLNASQYVEITLEKESMPDGYPERHTFEIYRTLGMPYYKQDESLKYRYRSLEGNEVEIEYLVDSGAVLAFREVSAEDRCFGNR